MLSNLWNRFELHGYGFLLQTFTLFSFSLVIFLHTSDRRIKRVFLYFFFLLIYSTLSLFPFITSPFLLFSSSSFSLASIPSPLLHLTFPLITNLHQLLLLLAHLILQKREKEGNRRGSVNWVHKLLF